jgi:hypothetical protein
MLVLTAVYQFVDYILYDLSAQWLGLIIALKLLAPSKAPSSEMILIKIITDRKLCRDLVQDAIT